MIENKLQPTTARDDSPENAVPENQEVVSETPLDVNDEPEDGRKFPLWKKVLLCLVVGVFAGGLLFVITRRNSPKKVSVPDTPVTSSQQDATQLAKDLLTQPSPLPSGASLAAGEQTSTNPMISPLGTPNPAITPVAFTPSSVYAGGNSDPNAPVTRPSPTPATALSAQQIMNETSKGVSSPNGGSGTSGGSYPGFDGNSGNSKRDAVSSVGATGGANPGAVTSDKSNQPGSASSAATASIIFRPVSTRNVSNLTRNTVADASGTSTVKKIPFGTMLPVRTLGTTHTLFPNSLARLELTRTVRGNGWTLPERTVIVAKTSGSSGDRIYLIPQGFILQDKFFPLQGEISGFDGAAGLLGERKTIGSRWYKYVLNAADRAQQILVSYLQSRGGGNITNIEYPRLEEFAGQDNSSTVRYVVVNGRTEGYILITSLPEQSGSQLADLTTTTASNDQNLGLDQLDQILSNPTINEPPRP